jgi:peptidoglycan/xylan/chitin deacetylase (PgdA/CDA1 family)
MMNGEARGLRARALGAGLRALGASGLPRLAAPFTRGVGAILMFHHVRPAAPRAFAPNRGLEITPEFLDETIRALRDGGYDIIPLDEATDRIRRPLARPFAVLTFDDGYRDNLVHALPVLERHGAPFAMFVATGFAEGTARLWWVELEAAINALSAVTFEGTELPCETDAHKMATFLHIYWRLRAGTEERLLAEIGALADRAGVDRGALTRDLCMNWDEVTALAANRLCTVGAHTLTHPRLAKLEADAALREIEESRAIIETKLGRAVRHLAYPVGDPTSAGPREFAMATRLGFETAVTTRKGMIFPDHAGLMTALPRLSVNGDFQQRAFIDLLLTGAPFLLWNRGRRIAA